MKSMYSMMLCMIAVCIVMICSNNTTASAYVTQYDVVDIPKDVKEELWAEELSGVNGQVGTTLESVIKQGGKNLYDIYTFEKNGKILRGDPTDEYFLGEIVPKGKRAGYKISSIEKVISPDDLLKNEIFSRKSLIKAFGQPIIEKRTPKNLDPEAAFGYYVFALNGHYMLYYGIMQDSFWGTRNKVHIANAQALDYILKEYRKNRGDKIPLLTETFIVKKKKLYVVKTNELAKGLHQFKGTWYFNGKKVSKYKLKKKPKINIEKEPLSVSYTTKGNKYIASYGNEFGEDIHPIVTATNNVEQDIPVKASYKRDGKKTLGIFADEPGKYEVTYTATDYVGNKATEKIEFIVAKKSDSLVQLKDKEIVGINDSIELEKKVKVEYKKSDVHYKKTEKVIWPIQLPISEIDHYAPNDVNYTPNDEKALNYRTTGIRQIHQDLYEVQGVTERTGTTVRQRIKANNSYMAKLKAGITTNLKFTAYQNESGEVMYVPQAAQTYFNEMAKNKVLLSKKQLIYAHITGSVSTVLQKALVETLFLSQGTDEALAKCTSELIISSINLDYMGTEQATKSCTNEILNIYDEVLSEMK